MANRTSRRARTATGAGACFAPNAAAGESAPFALPIPHVRRHLRELVRHDGRLDEVGSIVASLLGSEASFGNGGLCTVDGGTAAA